MARASSPLDRVVTALVPSLSRSLAEQFNVFRVMRHGTHEKQLSNVFAWLLSADGTHHLGDAFQRMFVEHVNSGLKASPLLPLSGYRVLQEVDTSGPFVGDEADGKDAQRPEESVVRGRDIADIVLTRPGASIVVENFETSDGHGHDYEGYLRHGADLGGGRSVVVLLCARHVPEAQVEGWQGAVVVTYAKLLEDLRSHVAGDRAWRTAYPPQLAFLNEMFQHFLEGPAAMSTDDRIAFITTMCETGEAVRYGHRPRDTAAKQFGTLVGQHAARQFEEGLRTLVEVKDALRRFASQTLMGQVNAVLPVGGIESVDVPLRGRWEWCVVLRRPAPEQAVLLEFGPTALAENSAAPDPLPSPDYRRVFVARQAADSDAVARIVQTDVGLDELLAGLSPEDGRIRDAVLEVLTAG